MLRLSFGCRARAQPSVDDAWILRSRRNNNLRLSLVVVRNIATLYRKPRHRYSRTRHGLHLLNKVATRQIHVLVKVPQMAESINEGTPSSLTRQIGDFVESDEAIASIETDKTDVCVDTPQAGGIREVFVAVGDTVTVGQDLARIDTEAGADTHSSRQSGNEKPDTTSVEADFQAMHTNSTDAFIGRTQDTPGPRDKQNSPERPLGTTHL